MKRILALLLLAGCGSADPRGLYALSQVDPAHDDPGGLAVAVAPPAALRLMPGRTRLIVTLQEAGAAPLRQVFALVPSSAEAPAEGAQVFALRDADLPVLRAMQATGAAAERAGTGGSLEIGVEADACMTQPEIPPEARGSVWIRTRAEAGFAPLLRDLPLDEIPGWREAAEKIGRCTP